MAVATIAHVLTHPEIDFQIARTSELPIAHLKCHRHLVILVKLLVKAFARMGAHLDVVRMGGGQKT